MGSKGNSFLRCTLSIFALAGMHRLSAQTPSQSTPVSSVPSWFSHCAGENGQCPIIGTAQVIFGSATGSSPTAGGTFLTQTVSGSVPCSNSVFGDAAPGHSKACWYGPVAGLGSGKILKSGGSNYPFYVQNFGQWDGNQRVLVGLYHLNPTLVEAQLNQMYQSGQRHISLVIWYMPFLNSTTPVAGSSTVWPDVWGAWINSSGGALSSQAQQNLTAICNLVKGIGFTGLTVRFSPIGSVANPTSWATTWNESSFQQDEAFTFSTRQLVETALAGSAVSRMYDLGIELGGIPHTLNADGQTYADGQTPEWTERIWSDYVSKYGAADSYGTSIAYNFGALTTAIAQYDKVGSRPATYGLDSYGFSDLWMIYQELSGAHEAAKPVILQETYYNDPGQMQAIQLELQHVPLTVTYLDQWPASEIIANGDGITPPTNYGAYGGSSAATGTLTLHPCTLAAGSTTCTTQVSWATSNATNVALYINGVQAQNQPNITSTLTGTANVQLSIVPTSLVLVSAQGTLASALPGVNAATSASATASAANSTLLGSLAAVAVDPTAPAVVAAGLGGATNQAIWAIGSHMSPLCTVQLYDPAALGAAPLAVVNNVNCAPTYLGFNIPTAVSQNYSSVSLTVTNPGSTPSSPFTLQIQPIPTLSRAGLGGSGNHAIWALGNNMSPGCSVNLYDPKAPNPAPLATISGVNCAPQCLAFLIPGFIQQNYPVINLTVTNPGRQESAPVSVGLWGGAS